LEPVVLQVVLEEGQPEGAVVIVAPSVKVMTVTAVTGKTTLFSLVAVVVPLVAVVQPVVFILAVVVVVGLQLLPVHP